MLEVSSASADSEMSINEFLLTLKKITNTTQPSVGGLFVKVNANE